MLRSGIRATAKCLRSTGLNTVRSSALRPALREQKLLGMTKRVAYSSQAGVVSLFSPCLFVVVLVPLFQGIAPPVPPKHATSFIMNTNHRCSARYRTQTMLSSPATPPTTLTKCTSRGKRTHQASTFRGKFTFATWSLTELLLRKPSNLLQPSFLHQPAVFHHSFQAESWVETLKSPTT